MSSDDAYAAFLDKANEDPSGGRADRTNGAHASGANGANGLNGNHPGVSQTEVPQRLVTAARDRFYVSDSDEPWVPVSYGIGEASSLPTEGLNKPADSITILDPVDWDSQGQYKPLIDELRVESKGNDVRVYRVQIDSVRVEYWLVSHLDGNLLGYKAKAVES
ncbi:uncharacterized protein SPSK_01983 [Sporothrix schenckii 1099-18]|uniref:Uncharacterized protein n=1 Tax=Sporothrix schenckii 1099-18 TaxID=1397361 RepID=A0A0F2MBM0_SPOSC|nr:uncharacterized protein SPSK_01983 [Sporothrix schenckii 1099-18]KJR87098.1 hypothetical protein SPSK_01983 [Sporothrix schenckii 1099-18]